MTFIESESEITKITQHNSNLLQKVKVISQNTKVKQMFSIFIEWESEITKITKHNRNLLEKVKVKSQNNHKLNRCFMSFIERESESESEITKVYFLQKVNTQRK